MMYNFFSLSFIASALLSASLFVYIFMRRREGMSVNIYLLLICTSIWSFFYGLELSSVTSFQIKYYLQLQYVGIAMLPVFFFLFMLNYTGMEKKLSRSVIPFFFIVPLITLAMVLSNDTHNLFYARSFFETTDNYYHLVFEPGPFYYVHIIYSYILIMSGVVLLVKTLYGQKKRQRNNILILLFGTIIPFAVSIAYVFGLRPLGFIDLTPLGFLVMGLILAYGAFKSKLFEYTPIVLNYLYEIIPDAIFVLDSKSTIINTNPSADRLLNSGFLMEGLQNQDCLSYKELSDHEEIQSGELVFMNKVFFVTKKAVIERNIRQVGLMIILKDITELKNLEYMQELLMSIALKFINSPLNEYESTVNSSLEQIGRFVNADRAYVVNYLFNQDVYSVTHDWCKEGVSSDMAELQNVNLQDISSLVVIHKNRENFYFEDLNTLPPDWSKIRESLMLNEVKSFLAIPMMNGSDLIGFLGFEWLYVNHKYSEKEQQLLQLFTEILVNLNNRKEINCLLQHQTEVEKLTAEISSVFIPANSQNIQEIITKMLEKLGRFYKVDSAFLLELNKDQPFAITEWCSIKRKLPERMSISDYKWFNELIDKDVVKINSIYDMPIEANLEKEELDAWGVKSMIVVKVRNTMKSQVGFLGFQMLAQSRQWTDEDANTLKLFSNIIGEAIFKVEREKELIQAKNVAESASKAKSEFLSNTSHEIRTPLNGILGFTELLRNTKLNKVQLEYVENALMSANTLMSVITDILDFSKIESGKLELDIVHTNIIQLVEKASDIVKILASQKGLELLLNIQPNTPRYAYVDPIRLKQIMVNLLSNAVKFTSKGEVEICLKFKEIDEAQGQYTLSVRDTGIGIRDEDKSKLFKAFSQADSSITRRYGGTGLGLIISNSIAEKMGSKINFSSEYGKGSIFSMTFVSRYERKLTDNKSVKLQVKRVLIIDDNTNNRKILEHNFMYWGLDFSSVESGPEALLLLEKDSDYDLVLIDYNMPDMDGLTAVSIMREKNLLNPEKQAVVLLHSSSEDQKINEIAHKLQIKHTFTKPIKSSDLLYYLQNISLSQQSKVTTEVPVKTESLETTYEFSKEFCILLAEDVKMNMILVVQLIKKRFPNAEIIEATNGKEALELLETTIPDLVLMDVQMPVMDGLKASQQIRNHSNPQIRSLPIIALTAGVSKAEQELCHLAGMNAFISKPIDKKILYQVLLKHAATAIGQHEQKPEKEQRPVDSSLHFNKNNLLDKILNDKSVYQQLMTQSLIEFDNDIQQLLQGIKQQERGIIKAIAHRLKGSALNMEFVRLASLASIIDKNSDDMFLLLSESEKLQTEWSVLKQIIEKEAHLS